MHTACINTLNILDIYSLTHQYISLTLAFCFPQRSGRPFVAPRDDVEAHVAEIFQEVLNMSPIGASDDFFELGGQSMLGVHLIGAIEIAFSVTVPFSSILAHSSVEALAALVRGLRQQVCSVVFVWGGWRRGMWVCCIRV